MHSNEERYHAIRIEDVRRELSDAIMPIAMASMKGICHPHHKLLPVLERALNLIVNLEAEQARANLPVQEGDSLRKRLELTTDTLELLLCVLPKEREDITALVKQRVKDNQHALDSTPQPAAGFTQEVVERVVAMVMDLTLGNANVAMVRARVQEGHARKHLAALSAIPQPARVVE